MIAVAYDVLRSFYDYLMTIKCDGIRAIETPTTEYQEILQESNVDTIELFIKYMANAYLNSGFTSDDNYDTDNDAKTEAEDDNDNDIYIRANIKANTILDERIIYRISKFQTRVSYS